jgi:transcription initiation factor TFIID subunit 11
MGTELGPLTPDHLREALRRYKKDREGAATGFLGLSLEGRENAAGRMGGRKLFR